MKPVENWTQRERHGMVMTRREMGILQYLHQAKERDSECPFADLPGVHKLTIRALMRKGWIFISPGKGLDTPKYYISEQGERALRIFEQPPRRYDGICPSCNERPVHISSSGRRTGYCLECGNELSRRKYHHGVPKGSEDNSVCPRCNKRPRHVLPGGKQITYCEHCNRVMKRRNKRKNKQRKMELARRGELLCIRCKAKPRHYTDKSVYDYCEDCWHQYMREYNDRRRPGSRAAQERNHS